MGTLLEAALQQRCRNTLASGRAAALTPSLKPARRGGSRGIREGTGSPSPRSGHAAGVASLCPAPPLLPAQPPGGRACSGRLSPHGAGLPSPERRRSARGSPAPRGPGGRRTLRGGRDGKGRGHPRAARSPSPPGAEGPRCGRGWDPAGRRRGRSRGAPGSPPAPSPARPAAGPPPLATARQQLRPPERRGAGRERGRRRRRREGAGLRCAASPERSLAAAGAAARGAQQPEPAGRRQPRPPALPPLASFFVRRAGAAPIHGHGRQEEPDQVSGGAGAGGERR